MSAKLELKVKHVGPPFHLSQEAYNRDETWAEWYARLQVDGPLTNSPLQAVTLGGGGLPVSLPRPVALQWPSVEMTPRDPMDYNEDQPAEIIMTQWESKIDISALGSTEKTGRYGSVAYTQEKLETEFTAEMSGDSECIIPPTEEIFMLHWSASMNYEFSVKNHTCDGLILVEVSGSVSGSGSTIQNPGVQSGWINMNSSSLGPYGMKASRPKGAGSTPVQDDTARVISVPRGGEEKLGTAQMNMAWRGIAHDMDDPPSGQHQGKTVLTCKVTCLDAGWFHRYHQRRRRQDMTNEEWRERRPPNSPSIDRATESRTRQD